MSKSFKQPIYKDKGIGKKQYWRNIRSSIKNKLRSQLYKDLECLELPDPRTIVNDYNYCDYIINLHQFESKRIKVFNKYHKKYWKYPDPDWVETIKKYKRK